MTINTTANIIRQVQKQLSLILIATSLTLTQTSAQDVSVRTIRGTVSHAQSHEPLAGASVRSVPNGQGTQTDVSGSFELSVTAQTEAIVVSYVGFISDTVEMNGADKPLDVHLKENRQLNEVIVEGRIRSTELDMLSTMNTQKIGTGELLKAACCNLSESFETTPSVDVGFTDAVTGYKQIQMLGLAGANTAFTRENIPDVRGLASVTGLTFTPGAWVESMQLSKGSGSVVNGFEGTAGQINVEWLKPFEEKTPRLFLNGYQSIQGRSEGNVVASLNLNDNVSSNLFVHGSSNWMKNDANDDGFLDNPLSKTFVGANRWFWFDNHGWEIQGGIKGVYNHSIGGETNFSPEPEEAPIDELWGYEQELKRIEGWAKIGKAFVGQPWKSMGLQLSASYHDQNSLFGHRNYSGTQKCFYANYIYQSILGNTQHVIKGGASFIYDDFEEWYLHDPFHYREIIPGAFVEYTYKPSEKISVVAGLRADHHNRYGGFLTPRLHLRYAPTPETVLRASIGRSQRTTRIFAENAGLLVSNRLFALEGTDPDGAYGFEPEIAWNMGLSFTRKFILNYRDGSFNVDYYYTHFQNQVMVDMETADWVRFYNLDGRSFAHSFQAQLDYEPIRMWDVRLAYRYYHVKATYGGQLIEKPLIAAHRAFLNTGYETRNHWKFDYTVQWTGSKRVPAHFMNDQLMGSSTSPAFFQMNAQVSKSWMDDAFEVYAGVENITNYMQPNLILGAENPFQRGFDGSLIWGPAMGRNIYAGFRWRLF